MEVKALSQTGETDRQTERDRSVLGFRRQERSPALEKLHGPLAGVDSALACPKPFLSPCCVVQGGPGDGGRRW